MMKYTEMTARQRQAEYDAVLTDYEKQKALGLKLNMARGKPSTEQLNMVMDMCSVLATPVCSSCMMPFPRRIPTACFTPRSPGASWRR